MTTAFVSETPSSETHTAKLFHALRGEPVGTWLIAGDYSRPGRSHNYVLAADRRGLTIEATERTRHDKDGSKAHRVYVRLV